jgi:hypothetical protein
MAKWIVWLVVIVAAVYFGPRLLDRFQAWRGEGCSVSHDHDYPSPGDRFVAHAEHQACAGRDSEVTVWIYPKGHPESTESAFLAKDRQYLPNYEGLQEIWVNLSWSGASELTVFYPEGAAVQTTEGVKGVGVTVVYAPQVQRR